MTSEKFVKYHKIKRLGDEENKDIFSDPEDVVYVQEKIDGGNFRFMIYEGAPIFGTRTQELGTEGNKQFNRCLNYVREKLEKADIEQITGLIFYGECCVKHTINYDWERIPPFLLFDVKDIGTGNYLPQPIVEEYAELLDINMVPLIGQFYSGEEELHKFLTEDGVPKSVYAAPGNIDQQAEGVVVKNYEKQIFAKFVRDRFKEKNAEAFGGSPKYNKIDDTNNSDLIFKYCTNARIEKAIFALIDEGNKLEMPLMRLLPNKVYEDIMEEEWKEIVYGRWKIDFSKLRKPLTKRCLAVLQQVMTNNALNGEDDGRQ